MFLPSFSVRPLYQICHLYFLSEDCHYFSSVVFTSLAFLCELLLYVLLFKDETAERVEKCIPDGTWIRMSRLLCQAFATYVFSQVHYCWQRYLREKFCIINLKKISGMALLNWQTVSLEFSCISFHLKMAVPKVTECYSNWM